MAAANTTDGIFRIIFPGKALEFTGERMTTAIEGQIEFEHFHRYCLARDLCQGLDVLDVASGEGYGSAILAGVARSVIGVDIDAGSVAHAQESYRAENLRFLHGGGLDLPLDDASVDVVVSFETLEHLREHARFVAEVRRVLRPGGLFIVSTPDRTVYSARGEHFNEFHLLELAESEFGSFLRANFANAIMFSQRSMLGSVIAAPEAGGPWRSYERRVPEYIEASSGLARAPYLIGLASDAALPPVHSSAYIDRRSADEVVGDFMRAPGLEARAVECERERDAARGSLAEAEGRAAERERLAESAVAELKAERGAANEGRTKAEARAAELEAERNVAYAVRASLQSQVSWLSEHSDHLAWELARAYNRPWRPIKHFINYYSLAALSAVSAPFSARTAARFARSAQKRSPGRFDKFLGANRDAAESGVNPLLHTDGAPLTANTTEGREPSTSPGSPTPHPVKQEQCLWYYIGDTLDWLDSHSQLTGVGRVSTELFFASRRNSGETKVWPCIFGQSPSRLVEMTDAERLSFLAQKTGLAVDEAMVEDFGPSIQRARGPESGDHVFFTGLVWTPTFTDLFKHLARQKIYFSVLVYDIIPIESHDVVGDEYFRSFSDWLVTTLNTANVIYLSNNFVKDQIVRWALLTGVEIKARIVLIPFGLRQITSALSPSEVASRPQTAKVDLEGFVLSVGTIDKRKNQIFLCSIWKKLADRLDLDKIPQLVLVGRDDIGIDTVDPILSSLFAEGKILVLQGLSDTDVAGLYKSCLFTAFSSISEGYGLPVAESLLYGKLCLSSDLPTIREHAHDLVWYFDPDDIGEAVGLFVRAIDRPKERKEAEARILRDFRPTKWGDTFRTILTVAQSSLRERVFSFESEVPIPAFPGARAVEPNQALANARRWCSSDDPVVSILIVNWNAAALTRECIRQVWANTEGYTYEIVIADNGSSREDVDKLRKLGRGVRLLDLGCNRFFGEANNIAAEASHGRFLCILNNDAFVQPGWLTALIEPFAADPQVGATGPLFFFPDWTIQEAGGVLDVGGYPVRLGRSDKQPSPEILKPRFVDFISAAALLISRDVFMEAGGYDLAYEPAYYEDADLCLKIQAFGRKIQYCPESRVIHIEGSSANGDPLSEARRKALGDLNRNKFMARWGRYLRSRDPNELTVFRPSFARPHPADEAAAQTDKERTAAVYTPYALTPGGGERYLLTLAALLARNYVVTVVTPHPYSLLRLRNLGQEFGIDLSRLRISTEAAFAEAPSPDLMMTMGNHVIPPIPARGNVNIFLCQFPFPMSELPNPIDRAALANYDTVLVYSQYTAAHFYAALNALQLPQIALRIVNPPVQLITGDCTKKQRTILSVGRFFVGGHSKRHDALISSFKTIYDQFEEPVELHLAGSSTPGGEHMDYLASLKASAEGYPIHFHVNCSASELHSLYRDAFVYWHGAGIGANLSAEPEKAEHFGISIVEAMSAQAIPFALNSGGPREIIDDGETGFLYDSPETMMGLTLGIFSKAERPRADRIMRAAGLRAYDFATENFERAIEALLKEFT